MPVREYLDRIAEQIARETGTRVVLERVDADVYVISGMALTDEEHDAILGLAGELAPGADFIDDVDVEALETR